MQSHLWIINARFSSCHENHIVIIQRATVDGADQGSNKRGDIYIAHTNGREVVWKLCEENGLCRGQGSYPTEDKGILNRYICHGWDAKEE